MIDFVTKYPWTAVTMNRVEPWRDIDSGWFDDIDEWCPGWIRIIEAAANKIQDIIDAHPECTCEIQQFKEKFGGIRLYIARSQDINALVYDVIRELEESSMHTCMKCGAEAKMRYDFSYIICLCDECANKTK